MAKFISSLTLYFILYTLYPDIFIYINIYTFFHFYQVLPLHEEFTYFPLSLSLSLSLSSSTYLKKGTRSTRSENISFFDPYMGADVVCFRVKESTIFSVSIVNRKEKYNKKH